MKLDFRTILILVLTVSAWIFDEFTDEAQWVAELLKWGIVPEVDEQGNLVL